MNNKDNLKNLLLSALKKFYLEDICDLPHDFLLLSFNKLFKKQWDRLINKEINTDAFLLELVEKELITINFSDLCFFKDIGILLSCVSNLQISSFSSVVNKIIKEKITFETSINESGEPDHINFKNLCSIVSPLYFENWQNNKSIIAGAYFVRLCDYLNLEVKPIDQTPNSWAIEEDEFEEFVESKKTRNELKDFARLFSKPAEKWYRSKHWWQFDEEENLKVDEKSKKIVESIKLQLTNIVKKLDIVN